VICQIDGKLVPSDGYHRFEARHRIGATDIASDMREGTKRISIIVAPRAATLPSRITSFVTNVLWVLRLMSRYPPRYRLSLGAPDATGRRLDGPTYATELQLNLASTPSPILAAAGLSYKSFQGEARTSTE